MSEDSRPTAETWDRARNLAQDLLGFLDDSPCCFHAAAAIEAKLQAAGFTPLDEGERFALQPGDRRFVTRHGSATIAIIAGTQKPSAAGFRLAGAHTDSPGFKLKPSPETVSDGLVRLGVEVYGGPLRVTWMDRDLGLCGRVILKGDGDEIETRLYRGTGAPITLPNVALHMNRTANDEGLKINPQTELAPILGTVEGGLPEQGAVRALLARELDIDAGVIIDFDLFLYDTQPASLGGEAGEFVRSGRLDDLGMCHAGISALLASAGESTATTRLMVCIDSEEVGSTTAEGARSNFLPNTLERAAYALGDDREGYLAALALSRLVSADNAHARHPGYASKSEPQHAPRINGGPVIKVHASRAYATDAYSAAFFEQSCERAGVPCQRFVNRSDVKSGGTIGSMTAAQLGMPTADVGSPQFAMHSVRETAGILDHWYMTRALETFFLQG